MDKRTQSDKQHGGAPPADGVPRSLHRNARAGEDLGRPDCESHAYLSC